MTHTRGSKQLRGVATWSWVVATLLVAGFSCGNSSDPAHSNAGAGGGAALCVPGIQIACACTNGADGAQACKADGSGFGACVCSPTASGGAPGAGSGGAHPTAGATATGGTNASEAGEAGNSEAGAGEEAGASPGPASDFPEQPILEAGVPADAPALFAAAADTLTSPLCVLEPQLSSGNLPGAMFPSNWLRPRFRLAAADFDLYQIRLHSAAEQNDLVVYTTEKSWYLPKRHLARPGLEPGARCGSRRKRDQRDRSRAQQQRTADCRARQRKLQCRTRRLGQHPLSDHDRHIRSRRSSRCSVFPWATKAFRPR